MLGGNPMSDADRAYVNLFKGNYILDPKIAVSLSKEGCSLWNQIPMSPGIPFANGFRKVTRRSQAESTGSCSYVSDDLGAKVTFYSENAVSVSAPDCEDFMNVVKTLKNRCAEIEMPIVSLDELMLGESL